MNLGVALAFSGCFRDMGGRCPKCIKQPLQLYSDKNNHVLLIPDDVGIFLINLAFPVVRFVLKYEYFVIYLPCLDC